MSGVVRRFYRVRWRAAALLCLPGILLVSWYAFSAFARFDAYRRAEKSDHRFDLELFQLELYDLLSRDLRRMTLPPSPEQASIPRFAFQIRRPDLIAMDNSRGREERDYVPAQIVLPDRRQAVEVRLLGQKPWHLLYKQRSMKVQLPKGELLDGHRVFTLTNDPSPMVVGEQIILDYLDRRGVLVPRSDFARVAINDTNLGVFRYETQPEESLLRVRRREPGSMYSGDLPGSARTEELWTGITRWRKVAWRDQQDKEDYSELERLLAHVRSSSIAEFADFARHEIDLKAFAQFDALDVAFGCDQHNFRENHKLYFDPYRGRWEPIAWGFRGFEHDPQFNRVDNPLLLRLKFVPGWLALRDRLLYDFLMGEGSGAGVHARGLELWRRIGPELAADPWWDAHRLLPRVDEFLRELVRPMTLQRALLVFESELTTYERRRAFLIEELRKNPLWLRVRADETVAGVSHLDVIVDGQTGVSLESVRAEFPADCTTPDFTLAREGQELAVAKAGAAAELAPAIALYPAQRIVQRSDPTSSRGAIQALTAPELYTFTVRSTCAPARIEAVGSNLATGSRVHSRPAPPELLQRLPEQRLQPDAVPTFAAGEVSAHPFALPQPAPEQVQLGPGTVEVARTRVFGAHQQVKVAPGTRLLMAEGASLVFLGRALFEGTRSAPISIERSGSRPWGGIVVQGPATAGSRFTHVTASFGSAPAWRFQHYPGMIDLHDTADIALRDCQFTDNSGSDDLVHVAYVRDLSIEDSRFGRSHRDALDLEFTDAVLRRLEIGGAGDDALDLMGSQVQLVESLLLGVKGNGISAGEESVVSLQDTLIADAGVGVLAKNASRVAIDGSLLYTAKTGVRVYTRTVRYAGDSSVQADVLFIVDSKRAIARDDRTTDALDLGRVQTRLPRRDALEYLRQSVLGLPDWQDLPEYAGQRAASWRRPGGPLALQP